MRAPQETRNFFMSEESTATSLLEETNSSSASEPTTETPPPQPLSPAQSNLETKPGWRIFIAPAWFLLGILVGLGIFAAYAQLTARPTPPPAQTLDAAQVRQAAKEALIQAIQELQAQSSGNNSSGPQAVDKNAFAMNNAHVRGNPDARVSIVEFADFQCPFCGRHHQLVAPTILQEYVDKGKAKYVYKHLAFLGPESVYAAVASECAGNQGKFWEYHDYLFEHQQGENEGAFTKDKLLAFGETMNLDMTQFEKCLTNDETVARVRADTEEAQKFGVSSTPTFFVNGKPMVGLKSPDEFRAAIEQALSEQ